MLTTTPTSCLALPGLLALIALGEPRGTELDVERELNERHALSLTSAEALPLGLDPLRAKKIAAAAGVPLERIQAARAFRAEQTGRTDAPETVTLASIALEPGELLISLAADGIVEAVSLAEFPPKQADRSGNWRSFCEQFRRGRSNCARLELERAASRVEREAAWKTVLTDPTPEAAVRRALYRQRVLMRENSRRFTVFSNTTKANQLPSAAWAKEWGAVFADLTSYSRDLKSVLPAEAFGAYEEAAATTRDLMQQAIDALEAGARDDFISIIDNELYSVGCQGCHQIATGPDAILYDMLKDALPARGVRNDLFLIDADLWGIGGETQACQEVADHVYALLLVLGSRS